MTKTLSLGQAQRGFIGRGRNLRQYLGLKGGDIGHANSGEKASGTHAPDSPGWSFA